jgi:glycine cleavage system aminomethyltransferase T
MLHKKYILRTGVENIHEDKAVLAVVGPEARDLVVETSRDVDALGAAAIEG